MQTSYRTTLARGLAGYCEGLRESVPGTLPQLPQITTVTSANGAGTDDWVITIVDDETGESYSVTATGSGTEATLDANMEAAFAAHDSLPLLFSLTVTSSSDVVATFTARHTNRSYSFSATGGTGANTVANTQAAGGSGLGFGLFVARGSNDGEIAALGASTTVSQLVGLLVRTDANSSRGPANDTLAAEDLADPGKTHEVLTRGRMLVKVETDVTPASTPYVRRAQTSSAGTVGALRDDPAGSTQVATITPIADMLDYVVQYGYLGQDYSFHYSPTDGTTSADDAVDGLEDAAAETAPSGVTVSAASAATMTLTAAAGTVFDYVRNGAWSLDTEAASTTVSLAAGDADAIDVSSIAKFVSSAVAGSLAVLAVDMGPA